MAECNIHGEWTMSFEDRLLYPKVIGETNSEGSLRGSEKQKI
ncbi:hypothetical protein [Vibrio profundum]